MRFLFFKHTPTTRIYTLSLHDALPILLEIGARVTGEAEDWAALEYHKGRLVRPGLLYRGFAHVLRGLHEDRKSTRLNSSHEWISYAVFCLKKKTKLTSDTQAP